MPTIAPPTGQPFAFTKSPSTLGFWLRIDRGPDYETTIDFTTVTSVVVVIWLPNPNAPTPAGTQTTWTLTPIPSMTTASLLVASKAYAPGDTDYPGNAPFVATPMVGSTPLPPMVGSLPIRGNAIS